MGQHYKGNGRDIHKRGLAVEVKPANSPEGILKSVEAAMRTLKRRVVQEGLIRDMRKGEYYESPGQLRRKAKQDAIRRSRKKVRQQTD